MKHRFTFSSLRLLALTLIVLVFACEEKPGTTQDQSAQTTLPNILILMADDAGWKDFGCYGHPTLKTPNIDRLAATGLKYSNAFLTTSSCSPSRTSILSGRYAHSIGTEDMHVPLPDTVNLLPHYLKQKGYYTGNMLKTHYGPHGENQFQWYSNQLKDFNQFLDSADHAPFFMWVGFKDPHRPYNQAEYKTPFNPAHVVVPSYLADTPETRQDLANYYSEIVRLDEQIGWMMAELGKRKMRENTLVVFLSDNGAPFPRAKGTLYDAGVGTPLILNWPREMPHSQVYDGLVSVIDLAPTILDIAEIEQPDNMPGKSMLSLITGENTYTREVAFSERNWHGADEHIRSARNLNFKYITNGFTDLPLGSPSDIVESDSWKDLYRLKQSGLLTAGQRLLFHFPRPYRELYDVRADPDEIKNLADDPNYVGIVKELNDALEAWQRSTSDVRPEHNRKEDKTNRFTGEKTIAVKSTAGSVSVVKVTD